MLCTWFSITFVKKLYFSTVLYSNTLVTNYFVPDSSFYNRLNNVFDKFSISPLNIQVADFNIYEDSFYDYSCGSNNSIKKIIICLSNHRWLELNDILMDIGNKLFEMGFPVFIRTHPSLSKSRVSNQKYDTFQTSMELNETNLYLMGVSSLFFDLCGYRNNNVFRVLHHNDDNFGIDRNVYYNKSKLIKNIKLKYLENKIFITTVDPSYGSGQNSFALNLLKIISSRNDFMECWIFSAKYPTI